MKRSMSPEELKPIIADAVILDVRRKADFEASTEKLPGSTWCNPEAVNTWSASLPKDKKVILHCVRGGSVSNDVVDALQTAGIDASFIEGGIEAWKLANGTLVPK